MEIMTILMIIIIFNTCVLGSDGIDILGPVNGSSKSLEGRRAGNIACELIMILIFCHDDGDDDDHEDPYDGQDDPNDGHDDELSAGLTLRVAHG